jgi:hypothetical protein
MSTLIVPLNVAALCVGQPDTGDLTTWPQADFSQLPYQGKEGAVNRSNPYINQSAFSRSQPFSGAPFTPGIQLHWALPAALTEGTQNGSSSITMPVVPNRWLVTRIIQNISTPTTTAPVIKSFVIESDRCSETPTGYTSEWQPTIPLDPTSITKGQNFMYLGQAFELTGWKEDLNAQRLTPLTAVGYGEHAFSGFYPDCSSVFGYLDTFADVYGYVPADNIVSYRVSGWYSDPSNDPLNAGNLDPADNPFGWLFTQDNNPTATICSGIVENIAWNSATQYLTDTPGPLTASIAPSGPEALASLLAQNLDPTLYPNAEALINAIQFGMLTRQGNIPNAQQRFEERIHSGGFESVTGEPLWSITPVAGVTAAFPKGTAEALDQLNKAQILLDQQQAELIQLQQQIFSDWYKYLVVMYDSANVPPNLASNATAVLDFVAGEASDLQTLVGTVASSQTNVGNLQTSLQSLLGTDFTLTASGTAPRYYVPHDPVVAIAGPDAQPVDRTGLSADGTIACRLDSELVTSLALAAGFISGSDATTVLSSQLPGLEATPADGPATILNALVQEAFFLASSLQTGIAAVLANAGGSQSPFALNFSTTVSDLQIIQQAFIHAQTVNNATYTGSAPAIIAYTLASMTPPWLPLLLQYEINFQPVQYFDFTQQNPGTYANDFLLSNFALDENGVELEPTVTTLQTAGTYTGTVILTPGAMATLENEVNQFILGTGGTTELESLQALLPSMPQLAQGLSGTGAGMLMRGLSLQLPVWDPFVNEADVQNVKNIAAAIAQSNDLDAQPLFVFNPIRGGALSLLQLRIIDVFGRYRDYIPQTVPSVANSLTPPAALNLPAGTAFMPPRFLQPSRLLFRWQSAKHSAGVESNSVPSTTPIYGWALPDLLNHGLFIYAADGTALLTLTLSADASQVLPTPAPGGSFPPGTQLSTILADQHPKLVAFVQQAMNAAFFQPFLTTLTSALSFISPLNPAADAARAAMAGSPLALGDALLQFELQTSPVVDQSWNGFEGVVLPGSTTPRSDAGFSTVQVPVRLGDLRQLHDGLVGYWRAPGDTTDFTNFFSEAAPGTPTGGVQQPPASTITLTAADTGPTTVTLLFDPRGSVHATTGVLPVKQIDLPSTLFVDTMANLEMTFQIAPVLTGPQAGTISMPLPGAEKNAWTWVQANASTWSVQTPQDAVDTAGMQQNQQQILEGWLRTTSNE